MDPVWTSSQPGFGDPLQRSHHDLHSSTNRRRRHGSSGRTSNSSFVTSIDDGPDIISLDWSMPNTTGSDVDMDWSNFPFEALSASPASNGTTDHDHLLSSHSHTNGSDGPQASFSGSFGSNRLTAFEEATSISRASFRGMPVHGVASAQRFMSFADDPSYVISAGPSDFASHHHDADFYFVPDSNHAARHSGRTQGSAPSAAPNSSPQEPWSPELHPRYNRIPGAEVSLFGPATESLDRYASSVHSLNSLGSSPLFPLQPTPSPARSPLFSQTEPFKSHMVKRQPSSCSSFSGISPTDQTPRPVQSAFSQGSRVRRSFGSTDMKPLAQYLAEPAGSAGSNENAHSPVSDFVLIDSTTDYQPSPSPKPAKRKASEVEDSPGFGTVFVQHTFSPDRGSHAHHENDFARKGMNGNRVGGRAPGSHLNAQSAARARELREKGSCWICCLQRDSCSPGETCDRCIKRNQRAQMEQGFTLGCDRTKLVDLKCVFIPGAINQVHEESNLRRFCAQHIKRWCSTAIEIKLESIWGLPPLECEVYEFEPKTNELLRQLQYDWNEETFARHQVEKASPPLGMVMIEREDRQKYERYLNMIVDDHMEQFAETWFAGEKDDFMVRLLRLMVSYKPDRAEEVNLLKDVYRLMVISYMFGRTPTIPEDQYSLLYQLHSYSAQTVEYASRCTPRMANRQLKFLFCAVLNSTMESVLKKLQQILRSSKGGARWTSAFCALLGLAMVFEDTQTTTHCLFQSEFGMGHCTKQEAEYNADAACRAIDEKSFFLENLFRWKYHRGFNPLQHWKDEKVRGELGDNAVTFARGVSELVTEKYDSFLYERQHIVVSHRNSEKYCSRLVARFLISFFRPTAE